MCPVIIALFELEIAVVGLLELGLNLVDDAAHEHLVETGVVVGIRDDYQASALYCLFPRIYTSRLMVIEMKL